MKIFFSICAMALAITATYATDTARNPENSLRGYRYTIKIGNKNYPFFSKELKIGRPTKTFPRVRHFYTVDFKPIFQSVHLKIESRNLKFTKNLGGKEAIANLPYRVIKDVYIIDEKIIVSSYKDYTNVSNGGKPSTIISYVFLGDKENSEMTSGQGELEGYVLDDLKIRSARYSDNEKNPDETFLDLGFNLNQGEGMVFRILLPNGTQGTSEAS